MLIGTTQGITNVSWEGAQFDNELQGTTWFPNYGSTCNPNNGIITSILQNNNSSILWVGSTDGLCVENLAEEATDTTNRNVIISIS